MEILANKIDSTLKLPNVEKDYQIAKRFLQKYGEENETVWGHLIELLHKIMIAKDDVSLELHDLCRRIRETKLHIQDTLRDIYQEKLYLNRSEELAYLFIKPKYKWNWEDRLPEVNKLLDERFLIKMRMMKNMGLCIPDKEVYHILIAMRVLADTVLMLKITFWGKIFGTLRDYYVVECIVSPEELEKMRAEEEEKIRQAQLKEEEAQVEKERIEKEKHEEFMKEEKLRKEREHRDMKREQRRIKEQKRQDRIEKMERLKKRRMEMAKRMTRLGEGGEMPWGEIEGEGKKKPEEEPPPPPPVEEPKEELPPPPPPSLFDKYIMPKLPLAKPRRPELDVPSEPYGEGLNKRVYYVCNNPGEPWIRLPEVTPKQITVSRTVSKFLTGDLEADVISVPKFPGKEKNYLRAIIARISESTQISPTGYYSGGYGEEEEAEFAEGPDRDEATLNPDFIGVAWLKLFDHSQAFWAHHSPYILPQGRLTWWRPPKFKDDDEVGAEGEEGEGDIIKREKGPPILRTISRDKSNEVRPWSLIPSSLVLKKGVCVMARSNIWPGAASVALEFDCQYMYVGWGVKFSLYGYSPPILPMPAHEYKIGPEIMETVDPTPAEEEAWRIAHLPKVPRRDLGEWGEGEMGGEGEGEQPEGEEDDEQ